LKKSSSRKKWTHIFEKWKNEPKIK